ncbi:MAG: ABC transporter substrate-binding protein [Anaerolineae bacterium]
MFTNKKWMTLIALVAMAAMILPACAAPTPQVIEKEVVVEKPVVQTVVVEKEKVVEKPVVQTVVVEKEKVVTKEVEVEKVVEIQGPVSYPEAVPLELTAAEVKRLPIDQIVTYKALPEYHEPAWVTKLVNEGKLPPVKDRLPKEPQVYLTSGMADGIGVYGDLWRGFSACPVAGYNNMAGVSMGWFGIESYTIRYGALVKTGPLYRADQDIEPYPELAKSWEWSADGKELTMHLIEGAKWSDGAPFTADDVMFTWEGYIVDPNVNAPSHLDAWSWDGKATTLTKMDDYTIKWTFPVAKPMTVFYLMDDESFIVEPAHILKAKHPKWSTTPTDYKSFESALPPDDLPLVTMGPWVITEYKTDELMIMRRNPYYWKVDEDGNQLPYLDEIQYMKGPSGTGRDLCTMAGDCDHMNLENPSTFVEALKRAEEPDAKFNITWGPETLGYEVWINQSADYGVKDDREREMRKLFRDLRFRRALSHATDRDGIAQMIMRGPFLRAWAGGLFPGAPEFDRSSVVYYPYHPETAKMLLADIGLKDTNNDGFLEWTSGPMAGQTVVIALTANEDQREAVNMAEALVNQWAAVGIKVNFRSITSAAWTDNYTSGNWEMHSYRIGQAFALPFTRVTELAPTTKTGFAWHYEGETPRQLQPFEQDLINIVNKYRDTYDPAQRKDLMWQYNNIFTKNVYGIGLIVGRYGLGLAKRVKNVPPGTPVFMYTWVEDAILLDALWTPVDQQLKQNRPETLPVYTE